MTQEKDFAVRDQRVVILKTVKICEPTKTDSDEGQ